MLSESEKGLILIGMDGAKEVRKKRKCGVSWEGYHCSGCERIHRQLGTKGRAQEKRRGVEKANAGRA